MVRLLEGCYGQMIDLSKSKVLRVSRNHKIFDHPTIGGALIKVRRDRPRKRLIQRPAQYRYGNLRQWNREANEYLAALERGCAEINRLAGFMGFAHTSEGPALVAEKMTGPDGCLAPNLQEELDALEAGDPRQHHIRMEMLELLDDLERGRIIVGDLSPANIVRARERGGDLVVVDGVGERVMFPLTAFSGLAFKASIQRRRKRFGGSRRTKKKPDVIVAPAE